jgi:predicted transcriptional regulator of viral defense system
LSKHFLQLRERLVAIQAYLDTTQVFTASDFRRAFGDSVTDHNLLARAVRRGRVERVRRGVYVSKIGQFSHRAADPLDVACAVADDAVFCYLSALLLHGLEHNLTTRTQFYTRHQIPLFDYAQQTYSPRHATGRTVEVRSIFTNSGASYRVTTKEQTLIDCLSRPALAGGPEHLLRSFSSFGRLDTDALLRIAARTTAAARARLGWVLSVKQEDWAVEDALLDRLAATLGAGPHYFWSSTPPRDHHWANRWRLYLPDSEQEMAAWLRS